MQTQVHNIIQRQLKKWSYTLNSSGPTVSRTASFSLQSK